MKKKRILIIMGRYLPGYKDGGPVRSIKNLVDYLGDEYDFYILTCDRDHGDTQAYSNIEVNNWNNVGKAQVYYVPPKGFSCKTIKKVVAEVDLVYLCGCFNDYAINTLILKRFGQIKKPVVVAAMGLFSPMEFRLKYKKKKLFTSIFNLFGMFKNIYWSATSQMEIDEIKQQVWARNKQFFIAEDLPRMVDESYIDKKKEKGKLDIFWISRITPKKNLIGAIKILQQFDSDITFSIYGPIHDLSYWDVCQKQLDKLSPNIKWEYKGIIDSENVVETLKKHQVFLFPTLGENYGHVIQEALSAGCICLLSDQTPWNDLKKNGIGYSISLDDNEYFVNKIEEFLKMNSSDFQYISEKAIKYIVDKSNNRVENNGYRIIFNCIEEMN